MRPSFLKRMRSLIAIAFAVFNGTPESDLRLRAKIMTTVRKYWSQLSVMLDFHKFMSENPSFVVDLVNEERALSGSQQSALMITSGKEQKL